jgi:hypothetical protein
MACSIDSWVPTALDDRVGAEPVGEVLDPGHPVLAALGDDVGRAELAGKPLAGLVAAHGDDPVGAELAGGQHGQQPDRAVTDHRHRLVWAGLGGHRPEPAGAEHIGGGQQARDQVVRRKLGGGDQGAVGQRDPQVLGLGTLGADGLPVDAGGLVAGLADLAGVVGGEERPDHELTGPDVADLAADLLDDAGVLMAHRRRPLGGVEPPVGPQVRAAHTSGRQPEDGVGRLEELGVVAFFHADVAGGIQDSSAVGVRATCFRS